ncbi:MAG TPA: damage-inducible protein CinA [Anaerolineaceae bacterium]|nr:damage-inducible protein CinA [Anaerolineaceae bacterium]
MASEKIEALLGALLIQKRMYLATAESCTGGLIANRITDIPGSSAYFLGGMVTYSYPSKMQWLGVKEETLNRYGAVSRETVVEMAFGVAHNLESICDASKLITIAVSGIAGPDGGTPTKPVGFVWIGWFFNNDLRATSFQFQGDRILIKNQSVDQALLGAYNWLLDLPN